MVKNLKHFFYLSLGCVLVQGICLLCIPFFKTEDKMNFVFAIVFWLFTVLYIFSIFMNSKERKKIEKSKFRIKSMKKNHIGVISFFQNREATVADVLFIVLTVVTVILMFFRTEIEQLLAIVLFLWFISLNLHCLFNGKNYIYIKAYEIYKKEHGKNEQKKCKDC